MNKVEQIKAQIEWCIRVGLLPCNYKKTDEYKNIIKELGDGNK